MYAVMGFFGRLESTAASSLFDALATVFRGSLPFFSAAGGARLRFAAAAPLPRRIHAGTRSGSFFLSSAGAAQSLSFRYCWWYTPAPSPLSFGAGATASFPFGAEAGGGADWGADASCGSGDGALARLASGISV